MTELAQETYMNNGTADKYYPRGSAVHTPSKGKKGHGAVTAGKAVVRKSKKGGGRTKR